MELFSERLKWLREKKGLTQKEMAENIGVSPQYYGRFEKGTGEPNLETLVKIRIILDESLDFIVGYILDDRRTELLYDIYVDARQNREDTEEDIEYALTEVKEFSSEERRLKIIKKYREELKEWQTKENIAFEAFFDYIKDIPGFVGSFTNPEFWKNNYYDIYHEGNKEKMDRYKAELNNLGIEKDPS